MTGNKRARRNGRGADKSAREAPHRYIVALGSNRPRGGGLGPRRLIAAALAAIDAGPVRLLAASATIDTPPLGPGGRRYANAAAMVETALDPPALLAHLQAIEHRFGRRRTRRWGARTLDLDIILWSDGRWRGGRKLTVPHPAFAKRRFVLVPAHAIAPRWRDPTSGLSLAQLLARSERSRRVPAPPKPVDPSALAL